MKRVPTLLAVLLIPLVLAAADTPPEVLIAAGHWKRAEAQSGLEKALALKPNLRGAKDDLQPLKKGR